MIMDRALAAIYDNTDGGAEAGSAVEARAPGKENRLRLAQWLGMSAPFSRRRGVHYPE